MKKNNFYSAIAVLTLLSAAGLASAANGTLNFTGNVSSNTCQITGMSGNLNMPTVAVTEFQALTDGKVGSSVVANIELSNCPTAMPAATLNMQWPTDSGSQQRLNLGSTTFRGGWVYITPTNSGTAIDSNVNHNIPLANGSGSFSFKPTLFRQSTGSPTTSPTVTAGNFTVPLTLTMTFQ